MILSYSLRLLCLGLAAFFLVQLAFGVLIRMSAPAALRRASGINPRSGAALLLTLRLLPLAAGIFTVVALCIPSYLWFEPVTTSESVSVACLAAAALGVFVLSGSIIRGLLATARSIQFSRNSKRGLQIRHVSSATAAISILESSHPMLALTGLIRPAVVISRGVLTALSPEQLDAALRHEYAHRSSRDNLKRMLLAFTPDLFPFYRGLKTIELQWVRLTEWAADDRAVAGDARRSLDLADALVRVARIGSPEAPPTLATAFLQTQADVSTRVERLLRATPSRADAGSGVRLIAISAVILVAGLLAAATQPSVFRGVHQALEFLVD